MSARRLQQYQDRVARGMEWLELHGPGFGLDVALAAASTADLDMGSGSQDVLSLAFKGYVPPWKKSDVFNLVCDRIQDHMVWSDKVMRKFLIDNGFDLKALNWVQCNVLRMGSDSDWELLTEVWIKALQGTAK